MLQTTASSRNDDQRLTDHPAERSRSSALHELHHAECRSSRRDQRGRWRRTGIEPGDRGCRARREHTRGWERVGIREGYGGLQYPDQYPDGGLVVSLTPQWVERIATSGARRRRGAFAHPILDVLPQARDPAYMIGSVRTARTLLAQGRRSVEDHCGRGRGPITRRDRDGGDRTASPVGEHDHHRHAFAWGLLARRGWAWGLGLVAAVVHLILAGLALAGGGFIAQDLLWVVVPVIVVVHLLGPGRRTPGGMPS
jgi:hypothetical protein